MNNVWKGLLVGGALGAGVGIVLDGGARAGRGVANAASRVGEQLGDADVAGRAVDLTNRVVGSEPVHHASELIQQASERVGNRLPSGSS